MYAIRSYYASCSLCRYANGEMKSKYQSALGMLLLTLRAKGGAPPGKRREDRVSSNSV